MRRFNGLLASLFIVASLSGCGSDVSEQLSPTATVTGSVYKQGRLVPAVTVAMGQIVTVTGTDGEFELQNVPVGPAQPIRVGGHEGHVGVAGPDTRIRIEITEEIDPGWVLITDGLIGGFIGGTGGVSPPRVVTVSITVLP